MTDRCQVCNDEPAVMTCLVGTRLGERCQQREQRFSLEGLLAEDSQSTGGEHGN